MRLKQELCQVKVPLALIGGRLAHAGRKPGKSEKTRQLPSISMVYGFLGQSIMGMLKVGVYESVMD